MKSAGVGEKERERETKTIIKAIHQLFCLERGYSRIDRPRNMEADFLGSDLGFYT